MSDDSNPFSRHHQGPGPYDPEPKVANRPAPRRNPFFSTCGVAAGAVFAFALLSLVCCGGFGYFMYSMVQEPVAQAAVILEADEEISKRLGTPIETTIGFGSNQKYKRENNNGSAHAEFSVIGPNDKAQVDADLILTEGVWSAKKIVVTFPNGEVITLPR